MALTTGGLLFAVLIATALLSGVSLQSVSEKAAGELFRLALYLGLSAVPLASALALLSSAVGAAYAKGRTGTFMSGFALFGGIFLVKQAAKILSPIGSRLGHLGSVPVGKFAWIKEIAGVRVQISALPSSEDWPLWPILLGMLAIALALPLAARILEKSEV